MHLPMRQALRCHARSKRSGKSCKSPAVKGHRGGAPKGNRNAWKHGLYSAETLALNRHIRDLARATKELCGAI